MTLRYPYELRDAKDYFYDIADEKVEPELLSLAQHILKTKEAKFACSVPASPASPSPRRPSTGGECLGC